MQFKVLALVFATMASVASAGETVTVYACESSTTAVAPTSTYVAPSTVPPYATGISSTGGVTIPHVPTTSPIFEGAASVNGVSALGLIIAGGVALFL